MFDVLIPAACTGALLTLAWAALAAARRRVVARRLQSTPGALRCIRPIDPREGH